MGYLPLSGSKESSQVGLICYSDEREKFIKPKKGIAQAYEIIYNLKRLEPKSTKTNLNKAISFGLDSIKRRSVIIIISRFY
ncbi:MAG: VWA domain-containing protein [Cytophagales bacterium]|nr:VWA domain-containing protein [Cytophagales bacterium]